MINRIVVASNNSAKTEEIKAVFKEFGVDVINYRDILNEKQFPEESINDQLKNAIQKATYIKNSLDNEYILADDTGAYFSAFPDRFGLTTARELKRLKLHSIDEENNYLLNLYKPGMDRSAYLEALFVLISPSNKVYVAKERGGKLITESPRGKYSDGFDKIFEAENKKTFAEMPMNERIIYSHRGRAAQSLLEPLGYRI